MCPCDFAMCSGIVYVISNWFRTFKLQHTKTKCALISVQKTGLHNQKLWCTEIGTFNFCDICVKKKGLSVAKTETKGFGLMTPKWWVISVLQSTEQAICESHVKIAQF